MSLSTRLAVVAVLSLPVGMALAQTSPAPDTATLLKKIDEQNRRIEALEHKLEALGTQQAVASGDNQGAAASPAGGQQQPGGQPALAQQSTTTSGAGGKVRSPGPPLIG